MAKHSVSYTCSNCAHSSVKWLGCCPTCSEWNSFTEEKPIAAAFSATGKGIQKASALTMKSLHEVATSKTIRMLYGIGEWDTVLGGGIMPGSLIVLAGDPGIGKSTLLLHVAN